jgi:putative DNA primase/helicase
MSSSLERAFEDWKQRALQSDILAEAQRRGAKLKRAGREWVGPCPVCGGADRFSVNVQKRVFNCRGSEGGDVIAMVRHIDGVSFSEACADLTGESPPSGNLKSLSGAEKAERDRLRAEAEQRQQARKAQKLAYQEDTKEAAWKIWGASIGIPDTLAEKYLNARGIPTPDSGWPNVLRFHPSLPYPGKPKPYPVLVCRVDDVEGNLTAIWRIFLREDGRKADVENAKLGLGPSACGAVRLNGIASHIGIAEGVETALGAWLLTGQRIPVWSGLSTAISNFEVPLGVSRVTIFPDGDRPMRRRGREYEPAEPAGRKAAQALFARLTEEGIRAAIAAEPPPGKDYNDLWLEQVRELA